MPENKNNGQRHVYRATPGPDKQPAPQNGQYSTAQRAAARPRSPKAGKGGFLGRLSPKQRLLSLIIGGVAVALVVVLVLVLVLGNFGAAVPSSSAGSLSTVASSAEPNDPDYDKDANSIPKGEFAGTILEEGDDAGDDYVTETLFLGDSNTERMLQYRSITGVTKNNGIGITSMGITSVTGLPCVKFQGMEAVTIPQAVKIMQPRRVVMNFGTNNANSGASTGSFIDSYRSAIQAIQEAYPYADIIISSVFPITQNCSYGSIKQSVVDEFNLGLVELAKELDVKYLNWSEALRDEKGYAQTTFMLGDGVHLNDRGMEAIFTYFRTHSHITEDARPKPLNPIPVREGTPANLFPGTSSSVASGSSSVVSSSSSSSSANTVKVTFTAADGGQLEMGGKTQTSFTVYLVPGSTGGIVKARPNAGYQFDGWTTTAGTITDVKNAELGFKVPDNASTSTEIKIVAKFVAVASSSSVSSSSSSSSQASSAASSSAPPASSSVAPSSTPSSSAAPAVTINVTIGGAPNPAEGGQIAGSFSGQVTMTEGQGSTVSISITAQANPGFTFTGWNDGVTEASRTSYTIPAGTTSDFSITLVANFAPVASSSEGGGEGEGGEG